MLMEIYLQIIIIF